jgi:hypothetical protein
VPGPCLQGKAIPPWPGLRPALRKNQRSGVLQLPKGVMVGLYTVS